MGKSDSRVYASVLDPRYEYKIVVNFLVRGREEVLVAETRIIREVNLEGFKILRCSVRVVGKVLEFYGYGDLSSLKHDSHGQILVGSSSPLNIDLPLVDVF